MQDCRFLRFLTPKSIAKCVCVAMLLTMMLPYGPAMAQNSWSQEAACKGWNNPTSFVTNNVFNYYQAQTGEKMGNAAPSAGTNGSTPVLDIDWTPTIISAASIASTTMQVGSYCDCATFPSGFSTTNAFAIYNSTTQVSGHLPNRDPNTNDQLPFVPTQYNTADTTGLIINTLLSKSIRIGSGCGRASGADNAEGLYYNMYVTPDNAMMILYYACVFDSPGHGAHENPAFIIRVMKQVNGQWVQASPTRPNLTTHNDSLAYFVNSSGAVDGVGGWHETEVGSYDIMYKEWDKVVLNLSGLLYKNVRVEVIVHGCSMTQHFAYGYLCGECRPMVINSSGCPAGESRDVTTLAAPLDLKSYQWFASEYGVSANTNDLDLGGPNHYFTFRPLTEELIPETNDSANIYHVQADDFRVVYRPNSAQVQGIAAPADSMGNWQTFRCKMKSAIDPDKPFYSNLYVNVQNTKPSMFIDTLSICGGDVKLKNLSKVPGMEDLVNADSTLWMILHNPNQDEPDTVLKGDSVWVHFDGPDMRWVRVRTNIDETQLPDNPDRPAHNACYSEWTYPIRPIQNPVGGMTISDTVLCDDDPATLRDTTGNSVYREWRFRDPDPDSGMELTDTVVGEGEQNRQLTRSFTHGDEPFELLVRNGLYYNNPLNTSEKIWCETLLHGHINVFVHPDLQVVGDTIVCQGMLTDATVNAIGVEGCNYQWSLSPNSITGGLPSGNHLAVTPYAETSTYYVQVTSPQGCVAWDSIHAYLVSPKLAMIPADGRICEGQQVQLTGSNASSYTWTASPSDASLIGQDTNAAITVTPNKNTTYTLVGHGGSGDNICDATPLTAQVTVFPYPVPTVNVEPGIVDSEQPTVTLKDVSPYSVSTMWTFNNGETALGNEVTHTFEEATGTDSVYVTMISANELGCQVVYPFSIPVNMYTAWFPNAFTPNSADENAYFRLFTINDYEHFSIHIYNRRGEEVFTSTDPRFEWDGTHDGKPCPQGGYVYICRYRKPGTYNLSSMYGSVTLVR